MSRPTPGPWSVRSHEVAGVDVTADSGHKGATFAVCTVTGSSGNPATQADARLIAASPDLLKALESILEGLGITLDDSRLHYVEAQIDRVDLAAARAAVAKAHGAS